MGRQMKDNYTKDEVLDLIAWVVAGIYLPQSDHKTRTAMAIKYREEMVRSLKSFE